MKQQTARSTSLGRILWAAGIFAIVTGTGKPAQANTINYVIQDNTGLYDPGAPGPLAVDGKFTFDIATDTVSNFTLNFKGDSAIAGTYTDTSNPHLTSLNIGLPLLVLQGPATDGRLVNIRLQLSGIGGFGPYDILQGWAYLLVDPYIRNLTPGDIQYSPAIVGTLGEPGTATPEPSSWAMGLGGLAGMAIWIGRCSALRR